MAQAIVSMQDRLEESDVAPLAAKANFKINPIDDHFSDLSKLSHSSLRHYAVLTVTSRHLTYHFSDLSKLSHSSLRRYAVTYFP